MFDRLYDRFKDRVEVPIEVEEIRDEVINLGYREKIIFKPEDIDVGRLKGLIYEYSVAVGVYADCDRVAEIIYSSRHDLPWQRLACCKELIHACETGVEQTNTQFLLDGLVEKLLGPLSDEEYGIADFQASLDKFAVYQALAIMFPAPARAAALSSGMSEEEVAEKVVLPLPLVKLVLSDHWPMLVDSLLDDC